MHAPALQTLPMVQLLHVAPPLPQAEDEEPVSHSPTAEQQPVEQVAALHFGGGGVHEKTDKPKAATAIASVRWFMSVCSPTGDHS